MSSIQMSLFEYFQDTEQFTLKEAEQLLLQQKKENIKKPSIRARIYEGIEKGLFKRIAKGVYTCEQGDATALLINGDGRDLSFIDNESIDFIITDHPYDVASTKGRNRNFANYECFRYEQRDFDEKARVLKKGAFLVEFLPEKNEYNRKYLNSIEDMALLSGFRFYAVVAWKKGDFVANTGRKSKNTEQIVFFSKGKARSLRIDKQRQSQSEECLYMSGTKSILPTDFDYQPEIPNKRIHQAEKPIELLEAIIKQISLEKETGLDQFTGSANVGVAALKQGRNMILIEKDEETYKKAKNNLDRDR